MAVPTRTRILDAAWDLFLRQGFTGTTVTQIEASAQLSPGSGSFYRHFSSKQEVLQAVVGREAERIAANPTHGSAPDQADGDVRAALEDEFLRRLDNLRRMHPLILLLAREREHLGTGAGQVGDLLVDRNLKLRAEHLAEWIDAGAIRTQDADVLAAVVLCTLTGYHLADTFFGESPGGLSPDALVTALVDLITNDADASA